MPSDAERSPQAAQVRATDTLANERTYLAYVRTALAFIAFGFVVARFSLFAREFAAIVHGAGRATGLSTSFGTAMALFGVFVALLGAWRYAATDRGLREGRVVTLSSLGGYTVSLFVVAVGGVVAAALLFFP
jgi:putative membrane protein